MLNRQVEQERRWFPVIGVSGYKKCRAVKKRMGCLFLMVSVNAVQKGALKVGCEVELE